MSGGGVGKHKGPELDLVPILDSITSVIFFLILSSTFVELTKLSLPPSTVSMSPVDVKPDQIPLSPKIFGLPDKNGNLKLTLSWQGKEPNHLEANVARRADNKRSVELEKSVNSMIKQFNTKFPDEKSIQLGLEESGTYQEMISIMDGTRPIIKDIVLVSYAESQEP